MKTEMFDHEKNSMIITPKLSSPENGQLKAELERRGYDVTCFDPRRVEYNSTDLRDLGEELDKLNPKRALLRGLGRERTQKVFFRLHFLKVLEEHGVRLINSTEGLETSSDKFFTSLLLERHGVPTPRTIVCQTPGKALAAFEELGGDVILKPLIGSKGIGITRLTKRGFAERVIYSLSKLHEIYYLQEFVEHHDRDIRILVVGDEAIAGMYRISDNWKTNLSAGAHPEPIELTQNLKKLAVKSARVSKLDIAGVDIIESDKGYQVLEVNSVPGFTALQEMTDVNLSKKIIDFFLTDGLKRPPTAGKAYQWRDLRKPIKLNELKTQGEN